jgi:Transposase DDE domain group 1
VRGLTDLAGAVLSECRRAKNTRHLLTGLFRQFVSGRLAGYEDVNDAERLANDPAIRAGGPRRVGRSCCFGHYRRSFRSGR